MRRLASAGGGALALAGCGARAGRSPLAQTVFTVMLDWFPNADHAPVRGDRAQRSPAVGLDVAGRPPRPTNR
jgi:hypothetical protein